MTRGFSLRLRLTIIILIPLLLISAAVAFWAANDAQARAADRFDRSLLVTALSISRDTAISGGDALSQETRDLLRNTSGGPVFYHVYAPDGVFVTGYATPPVPPGDLGAEAYIYFDARYLGHSVRAVRYSEHLEIDGLAGQFTFTVWQNLSLRDGFVQSLSQRTYAVMATLVAAVAFIVWFGVRVGLRPLLDLERAIERRSAQDLTTIKRAIPEEVKGVVGRLNELLSEMSATIRAKDSFISDAAHQLRNPIAGVLALSEAVATSKTEADFKTRSADLVEAASHAAKLSEDLLAFERARSAPSFENLPVVNITSTLASIVTRLQREATIRDVRLQQMTDPGPAFVRADALLLEQAIENLVTNAFSHGGGQLTEVRVQLKAESHHAIITVCDDGKGVEAKEFETALSRFGQAIPGSGSGLGLPIANAVAEAHGGRLDLSNCNPGLLVRIILPMASSC
ncbi:sensor histidine kinase [Cochlodiniinecator piscidefendens]|uniref:sensor histidine kinase n=1 Tax=Cochlodiniinecator piscidefendens TaxID=2715756 RepID=UPI00140AF6D9|nr:sensor histidine kinase [Cochlodiniinecator piscidefendens]